MAKEFIDAFKTFALVCSTASLCLVQHRTPMLTITGVIKYFAFCPGDGRTLLSMIMLLNKIIRVFEVISVQERRARLRNHVSS